MKSALEIRRGILFGLLAIVVVVLFAFDLASGSVGVGGREVWALLTGGPCDPMARDIILKIRLIKAVVAVLAGFSLAASGLLMQTLFRNPLAGPFVLGISSGASLGVALFLLGAPLLGIADPRTSKAIDFIGGIRGTGELTRLVDSGSYQVAFSMYPTTVGQLMDIADAGEIMPPKSTWFEPKLRDGLVCHNF